ncbi:hypothetical protein BGZ73_004378 [Actinomortierella ambigua]|nr:hypothetical protein BGZ73_004378 [Actinomortierella ambigua]
MLEVPTTKDRLDPIDDDNSFAAAKDGSRQQHRRSRSRSRAGSPSTSSSRSPSRSPSPHPATPRGASVSPPKQAFVMDYEEDPLEQQMRRILEQTGVHLPDNLFEQQVPDLLSPDAVSFKVVRSTSTSLSTSTMLLDVQYPWSSPVLSDDATFPSTSPSPSATPQRGRSRMDPETLQRLAASAPSSTHSHGGVSNLRHSG